MNTRLFRQMLGGVTCGDCAEVMAHMPRACADFILTDPPYLVRYRYRYRYRRGRTVAGDADPSWLGPAFGQMYRVLREHALYLSFYGWNLFRRRPRAARFGLPAQPSTRRLRGRRLGGPAHLKAHGGAKMRR